MNHSPITLVECPRDAMQGWPHLIPTDKKIRYLNALLRVGFSVLDFGSFVSPKAIPQMADTKQVLEELDLSATKTRLLAIVQSAFTTAYLTSPTVVSSAAAETGWVDATELSKTRAVMPVTPNTRVMMSLL